MFGLLVSTLYVFNAELYIYTVRMKSKWTQFSYIIFITLYMLLYMGGYWKNINIYIKYLLYLYTVYFY